MRFDPDSYATVAERIALFYEKFAEGRLIATIVEHDRETGFILIRAEAYRSPDDAVPASTGHASEVQGGSGPQATNYIEVAETSAIGRALANLNFQAKKTPAARSERRQVSTSTAPVPETMLDKEIKASLEVLDYTEGRLNVIVAKDFHFKGDWKGMPSDKKREVLDYLNNLANEKANT